MGGGGAGGGGLWDSASVFGSTTGFGITTCSACATKMLCPEPEYSVSSLSLSSAKSSVGSSRSTFGVFDRPVPALRRAEGRAAAVAVAAVVCGPPAVGGGAEKLMKALMIRISASPPSTDNQIIFFLFSAPIFIRFYVPDFK